MMNKILIVEDNLIKLQKIIDLFSKFKSDIEIDTAGSFTSGWKLLQRNKGMYDFIIFDLSLPSFDALIGSPNDDFRALGGKELAQKLVKRKITTPFIFLTAVSVFDDKVYKYTFDELKKELTEKYPLQCLGFIFYNNKSNAWKEEIEIIIRGIK